MSFIGLFGVQKAAFWCGSYRARAQGSMYPQLAPYSVCISHVPTFSSPYI